jgi:hypothetical protein
MTFQEWLFINGPALNEPDQSQADRFRMVWDAAIAAETLRCAQIVWEYRGMCVSDESARALMAEVMRER